MRTGKYGLCGHTGPHGHVVRPALSHLCIHRQQVVSVDVINVFTVKEEVHLQDYALLQKCKKFCKKYPALIPPYKNIR